jgi:SAM-dependent methyltransferase
MGKAEEKTLKYYDENAQEWGEAHHGFEEVTFWKEEMERFHEELPSGKVLEIGSGTGKDAANLIRLGYDYVGTDASSGLLKLARKRNPGASFKNVRVQDLTDHFSENEFDGFWTAATLLHIPHDEINGSLENINNVVRNGGIGFISIKQGEGELEDETGRLFAYHTLDGFRELLARHGFEILEKDVQPMSEKTTWLKYLVKVNK